jgi:hypothetical protein
LQDSSLVTTTAETGMISLEDLIGFCDLTPDEVQAIAEHEHVAEPVAVGICCGCVAWIGWVVGGEGGVG